MRPVPLGPATAGTLPVEQSKCHGRKQLEQNGKAGLSGKRGGRKEKRASTRKRVTQVRRLMWVIGGEPPSGAGGPPLRPLDAGLFDLVEQGLVAHAENLRRLAPVPVNLAQRVGNHRAFGGERRLAGDFRQASTILTGG